MRTYPRNSPQAAARVVVFALLADGHLGGSEVAALPRLQVAERLGLDSLALAVVLQQLVEDMLAGGGSTWSGHGTLDDVLVHGALDDVDDPALRRRVFALALAAAQADGHLSDGEQAFMDLVACRWSLPACALA